MSPLIWDWDEDVRPFFGDLPEPLPAPEPDRTPREPRRTFEERRQLDIQAGRCPVCHNDIEPGEACTFDGWSLLEEQLRERIRTVEQRDDYVERLPGALDEYGPAQVEEPAA
jgi:hypothetical protein